jgi:hypothetical protein
LWGAKTAAASNCLKQSWQKINPAKFAAAISRAIPGCCSSFSSQPREQLSKTCKFGDVEIAQQEMLNV